MKTLKESFSVPKKGVICGAIVMTVIGGYCAPRSEVVSESAPHENPVLESQNVDTDTIAPSEQNTTPQEIVPFSPPTTLEWALSPKKNKRLPCTPYVPLTGGGKTTGDDSNPFSAGEGGAFFTVETRFPKTERNFFRIELCATVRSYLPSKDGEGDRVVLSGLKVVRHTNLNTSKPFPDRVKLRFMLPSNIPRLFDKGQTIGLTFERGRCGASMCSKIRIADKRGQLLYTDSIPSGARLERGEIINIRKGEAAGWADLRYHAVNILIENQRAVVKDDWRKLTTQSGTFVLQGHASTYGKGTLPKDAGNAFRVKIVRLMP